MQIRGRYNLFHLAEEYIITENLNRNKWGKANILLDEYNFRNQKELFLKTIKVIYGKKKLFALINSQNLINKFKTDSLKYNFCMINQQVNKLDKSDSLINQINNYSISLTIFFITELICSYVNYYFHSNNSGIDDLYLKKILKLINMKEIGLLIKGSELFFLFDLYNKIFELFKTGTLSNYNIYKRNLIDHSHKLSKEELSFHYVCIVNYLAGKDNKNNHITFYTKELFNAYTIILNKELYKDDKINYLPHQLYRNVFMLMIRLKKVDELEYFILKYSSKIQADYIVDIYNYSYSNYYWLRGNFEIALNYLNKIKIEYFIYKFDNYNLKIRLFFELGYYENCLALIKCFKELLRKDKLLFEKAKEFQLNFSICLEKLIKHIYSNKLTDLIELKYYFEKVQSKVSFRDWLTSKILIQESNKFKLLA